MAKSRLYGRHAAPGPEPGDQAPLVTPDREQRVIGAVLRTRRGVKPVYVSPGHLTDVPAAVALVQRCVTRYRLPEPTRLADRAAGLRD